MDETAIVVALITGMFGLGMAVGKVVFARRYARHAQRDLQTEQAMYIMGKIIGLRIIPEDDVVGKILAISNGLRDREIDSSFVTGLIGYFEVQMELAGELKEEYNGLRPYAQKLESLLDYLEVQIEYRQQVLAEGGTPPEIDLNWIKEFLRDPNRQTNI